MFKYFLSFFLILSFLTNVAACQAASNSFVSVVNPIRGNDFWSLKDQKPQDAVEGQIKIIRENNIPATWLIRFDALNDLTIIGLLKNLPGNQEIGLLLEVTPSWTNAAGVTYHQSATWHSAGSVFLTGYSADDRNKLIDVAFENFKKDYGYYPKSVGAWYIDSYSLDYMQKKYKISGALIVADQYTTDNYQIWGQYWSSPYYPFNKNTLTPAQTTENKIPVVIMQWAARDPFNGYGGGVQESTYSVQANDYIDYHDLDSEYFKKLVDLYTNQPLNQVNQLVIGLENSYSWSKYQSEYQKQIKIVSDKSRAGQFNLTTMSGFSNWYDLKFPNISPEQVIVAKDPLGSEYQSVWFMNPYYRVGWFYNQEGSVIRDARQYVNGLEETCYKSACSSLNFATFATRVLDDVTYGKKFVVDQGKITNLTVNKTGDSFIIGYNNAGGLLKQIEFMPRDIGIDNKVLTIDTFIMQAVSQSTTQTTQSNSDVERFNRLEKGGWNFCVSIIKFLLFTIFVLFIPGFVLVRLLKQTNLSLIIFLSICIGMVNLTLLSYFLGYLHLLWLIIAYIILSTALFIYKRFYREINYKSLFPLNSTTFFSTLIIILGTIFQALPMIRSGWVYHFGVGFWGPIGHDGLWHQALINELIKNIPPGNPALSGTLLNNYHYFYDLLLAETAKLSSLSVVDLLYRFYPVMLSIMFGLGTYLLVTIFFKRKKAVLFVLFFAYFAGSFGWIVEFIRERHFGGESAFWANQPVSMDLNPPFAISLVLMIGVMLLFKLLLEHRSKIAQILFILLAGSLIEFKVYAGIIVLSGIGLVAVKQLLFNRDWFLSKTLIFTLLLSLAVFLPQNSGSAGLLVFGPFWFIHSMVDNPDRVGWLKLSQAREAYFARGETVKYLLTEGLSLTIFIVGNLGIRFIALFAVIPFIHKKFWKENEYLFIFIMVVVALIIPLLFIQKGNPWNTIQFFYYFIYFAAIITGLFFSALYNYLLTVRNIFIKTSGFVLIIILLVLAPINAVVTFSSALYNLPPASLPLGELEALDFLKTEPEGVVLTYPFNKNLRAKFTSPFPLVSYETSSYVSAFSAKPTFIEDEIQQEIFQEDFQKRLVASTDFFKSMGEEWSDKFLTDNNIRYIYISKLALKSFDTSKIKVKSIYDNNEAQIFEIVN